jgi:eukaryotic-like serine/threonine-protein kinase
VIEVSDSATQSRAGSVLGTPPYMAPERSAGTAEPRSDVYSLGVILGEILEANDDFDIAPELAAICVRATQRDPAHRYQTARELHDAIERYLDGDPDLEARRKLAEHHAASAEQALAGGAGDARTIGAREIGRALGLDPSNRRALQTLMRLLSDVPRELPAELQAEIDRRWFARRARTMLIGSISTASMFLLVPFIVWAGVRDPRLFGAFLALLCAGVFCQWQASRRPSTLWFAAGFVAQLSAIASLTFSLGLIGIVPAGMTLISIAWRMTMARALYGVLIITAVLVAIIAPFLLAASGVIDRLYEFTSAGLVIVPHMNEVAEVPTLAYVIFGTWGAAVAAVLFGRLFVDEIRRAESQLAFQAWQLQQLVPPA